MTACNNNIPRIVRGNDFTLRVAVQHPVLSGGETILEDFSLANCKDIAVALISRMGRRTPMSFTIDGSHILVDFQETVKSGLYGLEVTGKDEEGHDWRFYGKPGEVIEIVESTSSSYIPDNNNDTTDGYYDITIATGILSFSNELVEKMQASVEAESLREDAEKERVGNEAVRDTAEKRREADFETIREKSYELSVEEKNNRLIATLTPIIN